MFDSLFDRVDHILTTNAENWESAGFTPLAGGRNNRCLRWNAGGEPVCVKIYRDDERQRAQREWAVLQSLADADFPNVPRPLAVRWGKPAIVIMSFVAGQPLSEAAPLDRALAALVATKNAFHAHQPSGLAARPRYDPPATMLQRVYDALDTLDPTSADDRQLLMVAERWRMWNDDALIVTEAQRVFGHSDGNIMNYVWNGTNVGCFDFEYAGWSDLAFECADLVEHLQSRAIADAMWQSILNNLGITTPQQHERYAAAQRMFGLLWLTVLHPVRATRAAEYAAQWQRIQRLFG